jgi:inhibitor of KinA sporulation pathway (predicted exonuclease)
MNDTFTNARPEGASDPVRGGAAGAVRFVVVDLEATCWERNPPAPHEVIEIGSVCFQAGRGVLGEFQTFVRPVLQPVLSPFCRQLTSILQSDVDAAPRFPAALAAFAAWADRFAPFVLAAWGAYDRKQLQEDCRLHGVAYPFVNYVNLKQAFAGIEGCRPCGMDGALRRVGLSLEGTHHRGIDDVRNIARLLEHLVGLAGAAGVLHAG